MQLTDKEMSALERIAALANTRTFLGMGRAELSGQMMQALEEFAHVIGFQRINGESVGIYNLDEWEYAILQIGRLLGSEGIPLLRGISRTWGGAMGFEYVAHAISLMNDQAALVALQEMMAGGGVMSSVYKGYYSDVKDRLNGDRDKQQTAYTYLAGLKQLFNQGTGRA